MKKYSNIFIKAVMAGCAISLGALANICSQNKIAGSLFFGIGLFLILVWKLNLFTGKVCSYLEDPDLSVTDLLVIYAGNFLGCIIFGYLMRISVQPQLVDSLRPSLELRITNSPLNIIILGFFCNICIYVAVKGVGEDVVCLLGGKCIYPLWICTLYWCYLLCNPLQSVELE